MPRIVVIVLAAGRSTRFAVPGAHKLLAQVGGVPVVRASVRAAVDAGVGDVLVVTGAESRLVEAEVVDLPVLVVYATDFADGMAASLRRGVESVRDSADAVMIGLGDLPTMRADAYRRIAARWHATGAPIVTPRYSGSTAPAHPTLFAASVFDELALLRGDTGARTVVSRDAARVAEEVLEWPAPRDIDTADDLALVAEEMAAASGARVDHPVSPGPEHNR